MNIYKILNLIFINLIISILFINCGNTSCPIPEKNDSINKKNLENPDSFMPSKIIERKYLLGKFNPSSDTSFIKIDSKYSYSDIYVRKAVNQAFKNMADDAEKDGIKLVIVSGTRTFDRQKVIWENKWTGKTKVNGKSLNLEIKDTIERAIKILTYSAMPGTSRHHWGTDIDINSTNPEYFKIGKGKKEYEWLELNASKYGFCRPYTKKNQERPRGHEEEAWHWSYQPLSSIYLKYYLEIITYKDLYGFKGAGCAKEIKVIENYIKEINQDCL